MNLKTGLGNIMNVLINKLPEESVNNLPEDIRMYDISYKLEMIDMMQDEYEKHEEEQLIYLAKNENGYIVFKATEIGNGDIDYMIISMSLHVITRPDKRNVFLSVYDGEGENSIEYEVY